MLRILPIRFAVGLAVSVLAVQQASAQSQSLFGNRGPIGQRNAQNSGAATSGGAAGGAAAGSGMFSRGTQGGAGGGTRPGAAQAPAVGNVTGFSGGFVGTGDNMGRFIGSQQAGQQGQQGGGQNRLNIGNRNRAGGGANDRLNQNGGFGQNQFGNQAGNRPRTTVRAAQRVAFEYPQPVPAEVRTSLQTQFRQLSDRRPQLAGISIALDGANQAVLRGEVATEDARKLAEAVARLEPGVRTVKNEITVRIR